MKLLPLSVYRCKYDFLGENDSRVSDATNGGASAKSNTVYIEHPQGFIDDGKVDPNLIFTIEKRGPNYVALTQPAREGFCGPMAGGNLAYTCDSRGAGVVYHIHDRFETWESYERLSV